MNITMYVQQADAICKATNITIIITCFDKSSLEWIDLKEHFLKPPYVRGARGIEACVLCIPYERPPPHMGNLRSPKMFDWLERILHQLLKIPDYWFAKRVPVWQNEVFHCRPPKMWAFQCIRLIQFSVGQKYFRHQIICAECRLNKMVGITRTLQL